VPLFGRFDLQPERRRLLRDGEPVPIGARALDVLLALAERRDRIVTKGELLDLAWPDLVVEENNLQVQISALRRLIGPQAITTIPGRGYRFTAALDSDAAPVVTAATATVTTAHGAAGRPSPPTNLPADLPALYGRAAELTELRSLVEAHRLVTVVGAGGIGKTSLALALAGSLRDAFDDGVWLVALAPITDPSLVSTTIAAALGIPLPLAATSPALAKLVGDRRALIVLDNCEHLLDAVGDAAAALSRDAARIKILATSQEPLKVAQEHVLRLGLLAMPAAPGLASAREAGAVALFEARARAADPRFVLTEQNVDAVADICRRLDGIALAIELAAARVPLLGVQGLRARLDERFRILTGGARVGLRRHQTLRAALDWSHGLLSADEQTVFRRLGVFVGSFGLANALRLAGDASLDEWAVLDHLGALVDKSLVMAEAGEEPRYHLLETSRAFALDKLHEARETDALLRRHAEAMAALFDSTRDDQYSLGAQARLDRYLPDLDNARAALDWSDAASTEGARDLHLVVAAGTGWIWRDAALRPEGLRRLAHAIAKIDATTPPHLEARLLAAWSLLSYPQTGPEQIAANERAMRLWRTTGARLELFEALCARVTLMAHRGRFDDAEAALGEATSLADVSWPAATRDVLLRCCYDLARMRGNFEEGLSVARESFRLAEALGDARRAMGASISQEQCLASLGRLEESEALGRDMQTRIERDPSLRGGMANIVFSNLCFTLTRLGKLDEAVAMARLVYPLVARVGRLDDLLDSFASLALKRGQVEDAARMIGRADLCFASESQTREFVEKGMRDETMARLRELLPAEALTRLMKEGEALGDDEAVRLVLRQN
jgi:predicted ATPase/DNA-binding winged helix-turn-helix (wHTH) protein